MKIDKKTIVMPGMRRKVTFIKLKFFRIERRTAVCVHPLVICRIPGPDAIKRFLC
jgi:hypothetical protein